MSLASAGDGYLCVIKSLQRRSDMKRISLILFMTIVSILFIPMLILEGVGPGVKINGADPGGIINFSFEEKAPQAETADTEKKDIKIKVYLTDKKEIQEVPLEEYIVGVLAGEMPAKFESEALKAQAVASRTYAVTRMKEYGGAGCKSHPGADVCTDSHCCQAWMSKEDRMKAWDAADASMYWDKLVKAVEDTKDMILTYNSVPVSYPLFFSTSSGRTENSEDVFASAYPYLKSVESPNESISPRYTSKVTLTLDEFVKKFASSEYKITLDKSKLPSQVKILSRTEGGSVKSIQLGNKTLQGTDVRGILNLNSANFNIEFGKTSVIITVMGNGHGVGMSQYGADVMARDGKKYDEILKHYYQGVEMNTIDNAYKSKQGV